MIEDIKWVIDTSPDGYDNKRTPEPNNEALVHFKYSLDDEVNLYTVSCKWDGCVDLRKRDAHDDREQEWYIHLCDLDRFIEELTKLRNARNEYFNDDFKDN